MVVIIPERPTLTALALVVPILTAPAVPAPVAVPPSIEAVPPLLPPEPPAFPPAKLRFPPTLPVVTDVPAPPLSVSAPPAVPAVLLPVPDTVKVFGATAVPPVLALPRYRSLLVAEKKALAFGPVVPVIICSPLASVVPSWATAPKLLPPWTKAAPVPVVLQPAILLVEFLHR